MGITNNINIDMEKQVRVRFAPSPTGPLHIGGVRTALYNYLFAKKHDGKFILRIEDTDQGRFVKGAEEYIIETFNWLGIKFDEGVGIGGSFAPYRQSDRKPMYKDYAMQLLGKGWAYYAFDTPEELEAIRKEYESQKKNFQYDNQTRARMRNSISLNDSEVKERRFKEHAGRTERGVAAPGQGICRGSKGKQKERILTDSRVQLRAGDQEDAGV
jgi:glutamyl-tRNA synthetase